MTLQLEDVRGKIALEDEFSPQYDLLADTVDQATSTVEEAMSRAASAADSLTAPFEAAAESLRGIEDAGSVAASGTNAAVVGADAAEEAFRRLEASSSAWDGSKVFAEAEKAAQGITFVGGATALTSEELVRAEGIVDSAIAKYIALGQEPTEAVLRLKQSIEEVKQPLAEVEESTNKWSGALTALGGIVATIGVTALAKEALDYTGRLSDLSAASNVSVKSFQRLDYAAQQVGLSMDSIGRPIQTLLARLDDKGVEKALDRIGLSAKRLREMEPGAMFEELASTLSKIENPAERSSAAMDIMGRGALRLMPLLKMDLKAVGDEAERMGAVLSDDVVKSADDAGDALTRLEIQGQQAMRNALLPIVAWGIDQIPESMGAASVAIGSLAMDLAMSGPLATNILLIAGNYDKLKIAAAAAWATAAAPVAVLAGIAAAVAGLVVLNANLEKTKRLQDDIEGPTSERQRLGISPDWEDPTIAARRQAKEIEEIFQRFTKAAEDARTRAAAAVTQVAESVVPLAKLREAENVVKGLSKTVRDELSTALKSGVYSTEELTKTFGISEAAIKLFEKSTDAAGKTSDKASKEIDKIAKAAKAVDDQLTGAGLVRKAEELALRVEKLGGVSALSAVGLKQVENAVKAASESSVPFSSRLQRLKTDVDALKFDRLLADLEKLGAKALPREMFTTLDDFLNKLKSANTFIPLPPLLLDETLGEMREVDEIFEEWKRDIDEYNDKVLDSAASISALGDGVDDVGRRLDGMAGAAVSGIGQIISGWANAKRMIELVGDEAASAADKIGAAISAIAGVVGATGSGAFGERIIGGAVSGASAGLALVGAFAAKGAALAPMTAGLSIAVGALAGAIVGYARAVAAANAENEKLIEHLSDVNAGLEKQFGSFNNAQKAAERYGLELDKVNTYQKRDRLNMAGMGLPGTSFLAPGMSKLGLGFMFKKKDAVDEEEMARLEEQAKALQDTLDKVAESVKRYGLSWADMVNPEDRLKESNTAAQALIDTFDRLLAAGYEWDAAAAGMSGDVNDWLSAALAAGTSIPASMAPLLENLIRAGMITDENAAKMLGFADASMPALEDIRAAADRYGISLDDLGSKVQQLEINDVARQLVSDWNVLSKSADDLGVIFDGMGDKVQDLVDDAIRYGLELPASMRPMIEAFIEAGELTDEFGNKITDINQLTFAPDLPKMVDELVKALYALVAVMGGEVPAAATNASDAIDVVGESADTASESFRNMEEDLELVDSRLEGLSPEPLEELAESAVETADELMKIPAVLEEISRRVEGLPRQVKIDIDVELDESGFKTIEEMEREAGRALAVWAEMVRRGTYSASEIERAWQAAQRAFAAIDPPLEEIDELADRAAAAGYRTTESLRTAATAAEKLWRDMVADGRWGAAALQEAWEDWQDKLEDADLGGMSRALREELDKLRDMVKAEADAPEYDDLGNRIFGVDEQAAMDRIAAIETAAKAAQKSMQETTEAANSRITAGASTEMAALDAVSKAAMKGIVGASSEGTTALGKMRTAAGEVKLELDKTKTAVEVLETALSNADFTSDLEEMRDLALEVEEILGRIGRSGGGTAGTGVDGRSGPRGEPPGSSTDAMSGPPVTPNEFSASGVVNSTFNVEGRQLAREIVPFVLEEARRMGAWQ